MAGFMNNLSNMDPDSRGAAMKMFKVAKGVKLDEIRAKEDIVPAGWEEKSTDDGQVYYLNTETKETQFIHPKTGRTKTLEGELPYGWNRIITEKGRTAFVCETLGKVTYRDPRLPPAAEQEIVEPDAISSDVGAQVTAMEILSGLDMTGWVVLITGASSGIGYETARSLAHHSAHVIMACRNTAKAERARDEILSQAYKEYITSICKFQEDAKIDIIECDLSSFKSIEESVDTFLRMDLPLHLLILNAAVYGSPFSLTSDTKLELTFAVNHMGHFYLTKLLTQTLLDSAPAQVILLTSEQHRRAANIGHFQRLMPLGVTANAVNPGSMIRSDLPRESCFLRALYALVRPWTKSLQQAAASVVYTAVLPENLGGQYIHDCCPATPHPAATDHGLQKRLWEISQEIVDKYEAEKKTKIE